LACGSGGELCAHLLGQLVTGIVVKPAADVEPLRRGVPVPAVLVGEDHLHDITAEFAELFDQLRQREKVVLAGGVTALDGGLVGRLTAPVRFADEHHAAGGEAASEKVDCAGYPAAYPSCADIRNEVDRMVGNVTRCVAVYEADLVGDADSMARDWAARMNAVLMSTPVPVT